VNTFKISHLDANYLDQLQTTAFTNMKIQAKVFWVLSPCSNAVVYQAFGRICCLHLHWLLLRVVMW